MWWKSKVNAQDKAILDLKLQRDKIKQYQKRISSVLAHEHDLAKQCLRNGDREKAAILLRRKKYQQQQLKKTDEQLSILEELTSSIEFAQIQKDVLFGLEQGNKVLKELNSQMSLERVDKIMDDSAEGIAYQQEVSEMLADKITYQEEDEIQDELTRLEIEQGLRDPQQHVKLPMAPKNRPETAIRSNFEQEQEPEEQEEPIAA